MNKKAYLADISQQIRNEINEFYTTNTGFILGNSFLINFFSRLTDQDKPETIVFLIVTLCLNTVWFSVLKMQDTWIDWLRYKARKEEEEDMRNIWWDRTTIKLFGLLRIRKLFYFLPLLFSIIFVVNAYFKIGEWWLLMLIGLVGLVYLYIRKFGVHIRPDFKEVTEK